MATAGIALRRRGDRLQRRLAGIEQRALVEQVVAGVGRQPQLGKRDQHRAFAGGALEQGDRLGRVEGRIGDAQPRHGRRRRERSRGRTGCRTAAPASPETASLHGKHDGMRFGHRRRRAPRAAAPPLSCGLCRHFSHRAPHEHRTSPLQHDRAADPHLGGARRRHPVAARRSSSAKTSFPPRTGPWPSSTPRCRCRTASRCWRPRSRRACSRSWACSGTSACSRSAPAPATWRPCWRTRRST